MPGMSIRVAHVPKSAKVPDAGGPAYFEKDGKINAIIVYTKKLELQQGVVSTGKYPLIEQGRAGTIVEFRRAGEEGVYTNIIRVQWEGEPFPTWMQFTDFTAV